LAESGHGETSLRVLGRAVRAAREQRGLSADDLAAITGMARQRVDALEAGRLDPTYELLLTLADGLSVQPSTLVALAEELKASDQP
jgi:transcriptional regulator with XRE-family HTH domain